MEWFSKGKMSSVTREGGTRKVVQRETINCPSQDKEGEELSREGHRMVQSPEVGGNLVQLKNQEKFYRSMEY